MRNLIRLFFARVRDCERIDIARAERAAAIDRAHLEEEKRLSLRRTILIERFCKNYEWPWYRVYDL